MEQADDWEENNDKCFAPDNIRHYKARKHPNGEWQSQHLDPESFSQNLSLPTVESKCLEQ